MDNSIQISNQLGEINETLKRLVDSNLSVKELINLIEERNLYLQILFDIHQKLFTGQTIVLNSKTIIDKILKFKETL